MPELTPQLVAAVATACRANVAEAAAALGRALDGQLTLHIGEATAVGSTGLPPEVSGPGLAVVLTVGTQGAVFLLPEAGGHVPSWCAAPDATGQSKLTTLAQELGMLLLPEDCMPDDFAAARVESLADALKRGGLADEAMTLAMEVASEGRTTTARLVWPLAAPKLLLVPPTKAAEAAPPVEMKPAGQQTPVTAPSKPAPQKALRKPVRTEELPTYTRSLLKIKVPVVVTLAEQRQPLRRIVELGPGSIIQFDKSCEEMLELEVGNHRVAMGEAVKVGEKFGLRITSMVMPDERFGPVRPQQGARDEGRGLRDEG